MSTYLTYSFNILTVSKINNLGVKTEGFVCSEIHRYTEGNVAAVWKLCGGKKNTWKVVVSGFDYFSSYISIFVVVLSEWRHLSFSRILQWPPVTAQWSYGEQGSHVTGILGPIFLHLYSDWLPHLWPLAVAWGFSSPCLSVAVESPSCLSSWSDRSRCHRHPPPWSPHRCQTRQLQTGHRRISESEHRGYPTEQESLFTYIHSMPGILKPPQLQFKTKTISNTEVL